MNEPEVNSQDDIPEEYPTPEKTKLDHQPAIAMQGSEPADESPTIQPSIPDPPAMEPQHTEHRAVPTHLASPEPTVSAESDIEARPKPLDQQHQPPESLHTQDQTTASGTGITGATGSEADLASMTQAADAQVLAASRQHTRRAFLGAAAAVTAGFGVYHYLNTAPTENMQPVPLEDAYKFNAALSRALLREASSAPTYPLSHAENLRVNGIYGLKKDILPESWRLQLVGMKDASKHPRFAPDVTAWDYQYMAPPANEDKGHDTKVDPAREAPDSGGNAAPEGPRGPSASSSEKHNPGVMSSAKMAPYSLLAQEMKKEGGEETNNTRTAREPRGKEEAGESKSTLPPHTPGLLLKLADITRLPRVELVTQFKCIEGWSQIVHWAGVRMADFLEAYPPELISGKEPRYVYMETPDGDYYTGYDLHVMRHPQTLLVTEMMGAPLTQNHGAPLRLHMPTKYGYKQIKRIGLIAYTDTRPDDYWTRLGYDWYAGL